MTRRNRKGAGLWPKLIVGLVLVLLVFFLYRLTGGLGGKSHVVSLEDIPPFSGDPFVVLYNNQPQFSPEDMTFESYEYYMDRWMCGGAAAIPWPVLAGI